MGQKTKKGKGRLDKFYHLAKEQGYRSRAAFKLIQLNRKYNFLSHARALLDLCAAPGGWMQVAAKTMPMNSLILGVDLVPIKPIRGTKSIIGDITTQATRAALKKEAKGSMFDVVVHDGAPNIGGAWSNEAYTQAALVLDSLKLATEFLVPKGTFVTKVFRSKDYNALLYAFNQLFDKVEATKPTASRNTSAEIFVVCQGYKAPAKIDPRLLDPKHLFQDMVEAPKVMGPEALMKMKIKQRRHREGYEEGLSTTHKSTSALAFLADSHPVELLGKVTSIALDGPNSWQPVEGLEAADLKELADKVRHHAATTLEITALCKDLQVLGRTEFKALLKWRTALRKALADQLGSVGEEVGKGKKSKQQEGAGKEGGEEEGAPLDPEAKMLAEMAELREAAAQRAKKEKKKAREAKRKARIRAAQGGQQGTLDDDMGGPDDEMFSLKAVTGGSNTLKRVLDVSAPGEEELELVELPDSDDEGYGGPAGSDMDSENEDEALRYELEMDEALEDSYKQYLERKGHRESVQKEKRRRLGMDMELDEDDEDGNKADKDSDDDDDASASDAEDHLDDANEDTEQPVQDDSKAAGQQKSNSKSNSKKAGKNGRVGGGLLVELDESRAGVAKTAPAMAAQWFGQELFNDPNLVSEEDEESEGASEEDGDGGDMPDGYARPTQSKGTAPTANKTAAASYKAKPPAAANGTGPGAQKGKVSAAAAAAAGVDTDSESDDEEDRAARRSSKSAGFEVVPLGKDKRKGDGEDGSESSGTDSEDEFDLLDDQGKAEVLALAKRMLRRKEKESIIDAAYNRYAFHDTGLPRWFVEDERRHMRPILPVTKEEVEAEKARLQAIDARPIKKVAEAKSRQKRRVAAKLQSAREKAEAIAAQEDVPLGSKMREIEKLYARARANNKGKGKGKGGKDKKGGKKKKGPPLDKRMLKDKRGMQKAMKKQGKRGGGGGGRKPAGKAGGKAGGRKGGR